MRKGGVRFRMVGHDYFNVVTVMNVAAAGSIKSMDIKSSDSNNWMPMSRNWGANWQCGSYLTGKMLSFRITITDGQTIEFNDVVTGGWKFGQTYANLIRDHKTRAVHFFRKCQANTVVVTLYIHTHTHTESSQGIAVACCSRSPAACNLWIRPDHRWYRLLP